MPGARKTTIRSDSSFFNPGMGYPRGDLPRKQFRSKPISASRHPYGDALGLGLAPTSPVGGRNRPGGWSKHRKYSPKKWSLLGLQNVMNPIVGSTSIIQEVLPVPEVLPHLWEVLPLSIAQRQKPLNPIANNGNRNFPAKPEGRASWCCRKEHRQTGSEKLKSALRPNPLGADIGFERNPSDRISALG